MDRRTNYLSLILLDALEDENESDINFILGRNNKAIDPSYVPLDRGIAPLHYVCGMQNEQLATDVAKRFLNMGGDPNCRSEDNMTPLHVAAMYGRENIVRLLLQHGADLDVYDNDRKTPAIYAIEECNFEVLQIMKDHIFLKKYEKKKSAESAIITESRFEDSLQHRFLNNKRTISSTPNRALNINDDYNMAKNKNIIKVANPLNDSSGNVTNSKFTPNRINYNYDVTSPYYINITHRRHKPQPKFPDLQVGHTKESSFALINKSAENISSISMQNVNSSPPCKIESVNIFSLTKENLQELSYRTASCEKSKPSLIESWREKVQKSRSRKSVIKHFDDIVEMIDQVIENDHLNFTNIELREISNETVPKEHPNIDVDSVASQTLKVLPVSTKSGEKNTSPKCHISLSQLMRTIMEAKEEILESDHRKISDASPQRNTDLESSYQTVPENTAAFSNGNQNLPGQNTCTNLIRSPKNNQYILQMTEAYVHTDDENGLVFYETKLLSNIGNKQAKITSSCTPKTLGQELDTTMTSQSTNITVPLEYETDTLRAELTAFGEPPGPITKTTKRLYIKRLIKYKRSTRNIQELSESQKQNCSKYFFQLVT